MTAKGGEQHYFLAVFTPETWEEFLVAGGDVMGFKEGQWGSVQKLGPGDYLLCYLTGVSRLVGALEVTSTPYLDPTPIWTGDPYPSRVRVQEVVRLDPEDAIPIESLRDRLSIFKNPDN